MKKHASEPNDPLGSLHTLPKNPRPELVAIRLSAYAVSMKGADRFQTAIAKSNAIQILKRKGVPNAAELVNEAFSAYAGNGAGPRQWNRQAADSVAHDRRPPLSGRIGDLKEATDQAWAAIKQVNDPPKLFFANGIASVRRNDRGTHLISQYNFYHLRHYLAEHFRFIKETTEGPTPVLPPRALVENLLATPEAPLPPLDRVVTTPIVLEDGRFHTIPGYNAFSRVYYAPPDGFVLPEIPAQPTDADIVSARHTVEDVWAEFPFVGPADRANFLAAAVTFIARELFTGPSPLHLLTKPAHGTGATLAIEALTLLVTGAAPAVFSPSNSDDEMRKRLTALLLAGPSVVLLDNLKGHVDSSALATALTASSWRDRVLKESKIVELPIRCLWLATTNNATLSTELARRSIPIRLDAGVERPWLREFDGSVTFTHPSGALLGWVAAERSRLIAALLTMVRAWLVRGRPMGTPTLGKFESWARVVGGILQVALVPDFLSNLTGLYEADAETEDIKRFLGRWWEQRHDHPARPSELLPIATHPDVAFPLRGKDDQARMVSLGLALTKYRSRPFGLEAELTVVIEKIESRRHDPQWKLTRRTQPSQPSQSRVNSEGRAR